MHFVIDLPMLSHDCRFLLVASLFFLKSYNNAINNYQTRREFIHKYLYLKYVLRTRHVILLRLIRRRFVTSPITDLDLFSLLYKQFIWIFVQSRFIFIGLRVTNCNHAP
jgi:hypothetical protein